MRIASIGSILADTNLLVYSVEPAAGEKCALAGEVLRVLVASGRLALSTQNVVEFFRAVAYPRRNRPAIIGEDEAEGWVDRWLSTATIFTMDAAIVRDAVRGALAYRMQLFDAAIWATARAHGCRLILTEDLPSNPRIEGVRYADPFAPGFRLADIGL